MTERHDTAPPRPRQFKAGSPPQNPGLPQATMDPRPGSVEDSRKWDTDQRNGGGYAETPRGALAGRSSATEMDKRGRAITARKLSLLDYYRLTKLLGDDAKNERTMDLASLAVSVTQIDADAVYFPVTPRELDAIIQLLDFEGVAAAGEALKSLNPNAGATEDTAKN
jgi:hypothetical protein